MSRIVDLLKLGSLPGGYRIFLRRNYDGLGRGLRRLVKFHRLTFLKRTRIVVVVGSIKSRPVGSVTSIGIWAAVPPGSPISLCA